MRIAGEAVNNADGRFLEVPIIRCDWCVKDPIYIKYHDKEWGVPVHDDKKLFEFLILEGAQAGLSWLTILKRREGYKKAFANFDAEKVARFSKKDVEKLLLNPEIIRNRLKVSASVANARAFLKVQEEFGSFERFKKEFSLVAVSTEGSGWAALARCGLTGRLLIMQIEKHNVNVYPHLRILMVLDVWEHAYYLDYKNERPRFVEAFWNIVNWDEVNKRLEAIIK